MPPRSETFRDCRPKLSYSERYQQLIKACEQIPKSISLEMAVELGLIILSRIEMLFQEVLEDAFNRCVVPRLSDDGSENYERKVIKGKTTLISRNLTSDVERFFGGDGFAYRGYEWRETTFHQFVAKTYLGRDFKDFVCDLSFTGVELKKRQFNSNPTLSLNLEGARTKLTEKYSRFF